MTDENKVVKLETITAAMAMEAIEQDKRERLKRVQITIDEVLKQENCALDAILIFQNGKWISQVVIIPKA
jgi:hypothetical protein